MPDLSSLGALQSSEPLDIPMYKDAKEFRLPSKGRYTVKAPDNFADTAFGATREKFLTAQVDPTIIEEPFEGFQLRFTKVSAKTWKDKDGLSVSQLGRYLRAAGIDETVPGDPISQAEAVARTANAVYQVDVDWRAYCRNCGFTVEGMANFPKNADGTHSSSTTCENCQDEEGNPLRLRANVVVTRFIRPRS